MPLASDYDLTAIDDQLALTGDAPPADSAAPVYPHAAPPSAARGPFPVDCLPPVLRAMTEHAAAQTSAPAALCAAAGLGASAASLGSGLFVESGPACRTGGNLFILAFAESGTGKGRAFDAMLAAWDEEAMRRGDEWKLVEHPRLTAELESARADLERGKRDRKVSADPAVQAEALDTIRTAVRRIQDAEHALACEPVLNIGNATAEAIAETLIHSPGEAAAIFSSEGRDIIDNLLGRYSRDGKGSDEAIFLKAYSGDPMPYKRKGKALVTLRAPRLTLCVAVQPDIWQRLAGDARMMESGFLARALAFDAKAPPARPSASCIPAETAAAWRSTLLALLAFRDEPHPPRIVLPDPGARALIDALACESADAREPGGAWCEVRGFAARLAENAWRLALNLHALTHGSAAPHRPLSPANAAAAVRLARWFFAETLSLLAPVRTDRRTSRMERLLLVFQRKSARELPLWVLRDNHGFSREEVKALTAEYPARLRIVLGESGSEGGRPAESAVLGPF